MWTVISTAMRALGSKVVMYGLALASVLVGLLTIATYLVTSGKTQERLRQTQDALKQQGAAKKIEAEIDALSAADARNRLRNRWGRR